MIPYLKVFLFSLTILVAPGYFILFSAHPLKAEDRGPETFIDCNVHQSACFASLSDARITLHIIPKPVRAMEELTFRLEVSGRQPDSPPTIDLGMREMKMGPNRVDLKPVSEGLYEGTGVIVRCASGRRTWYAKVSLPGMGNASFLFDVLY